LIGNKEGTQTTLPSAELPSLSSTYVLSLSSPLFLFFFFSPSPHTDKQHRHAPQKYKGAGTRAGCYKGGDMTNLKTTNWKK
jgi:hypothetical protein